MAVGNSHLDREVKCVDNVNLNKYDLNQNSVYLIKVPKEKELNGTEKEYPAKLVESQGCLRGTKRIKGIRKDKERGQWGYEMPA